MGRWPQSRAACHVTPCIATWFEYRSVNHWRRRRRQLEEFLTFHYWSIHRSQALWTLIDDGRQSEKRFFSILAGFECAVSRSAYFFRHLGVQALDDYLIILGIKYWGERLSGFLDQWIRSGGASPERRVCRAGGGSNIGANSMASRYGITDDY